MDSSSTKFQQVLNSWSNHTYASDQILFSDNEWIISFRNRCWFRPVYQYIPRNGVTIRWTARRAYVPHLKSHSWAISSTHGDATVERLFYRNGEPKQVFRLSPCFIIFGLRNVYLYCVLRMPFFPDKITSKSMGNVFEIVFAHVFVFIRNKEFSTCLQNCKQIIGPIGHRVGWMTQRLDSIEAIDEWLGSTGYPSVPNYDLWPRLISVNMFWKHSSYFGEFVKVCRQRGPSKFKFLFCLTRL